MSCKQKKLFLALMILSALSFFVIDSVTNNFPSIEIDAAELINIQPAGEIVEGFNLQQGISAKFFNAKFSRFSREFVTDVYLRIFLANYGNRKNRGIFQVSIEQDKLKISQNIDMERVKDNTFYQIDFSVDDFFEFSFRDELVLKIIGLDGKAGSSVTAWLTEDISKGFACVDGVKTDRSLMYSLLFREKSKSISYSALALFLTYMSLLLLLVILI